MTSQEEGDLMLAEHREARRRGEAVIRYAMDEHRSQPSPRAALAYGLIILVFVAAAFSMVLA